MAINGEPVAEYDEAFAKLSACHPAAHLRLARAKSHYRPRGSQGRAGVGANLPRSFSPHDFPTPILLGVETTVEIIRSAEDLGFAIVGGTDSQLVTFRLLYVCLNLFKQHCNGLYLFIGWRFY